MESFIVGLDFGTDSARGVLISLATGLQTAYAVEAYPHGTLTDRLPGNTMISGRFFLQVPGDYLLVAESLLRQLGQGQRIEAIGIDFTASSPLPAAADGSALADTMPGNPHAYVKLWKHSAQTHAIGLLADDPIVRDRFGGRLSGEWFWAKAVELAVEAPEVFSRTDRFIEAGDWLVWRLTGKEVRSGDFAAYKAQYDVAAGCPDGLSEYLKDKFGPVQRVGNSAGQLTAEWIKKTGILGAPEVAVAVIDSHAVLPAVNDGSAGTLVGAIGTSAAYLYLSDHFESLPLGVEGVAFDAALPGVWCYEAGQAAYGDVLTWFVRSFPKGPDLQTSFAAYNKEAATAAPGSEPLMALDWWNGNRVPHSDSLLSGLLLGLNLQTSAAGIYRALMESLCFGTRSVLDLFEAGHLPIERLVITSGLASRNPLLLQILADVTGRPILIPELENATCVGAAIHGAVAAQVVSSFADGFKRFGAREVRQITPRSEFAEIYRRIYDQYRMLAANSEVRDAMRVLNSLSHAPIETLTTPRHRNALPMEQR
jgi:L-ribulokinase